jgi:DNA-binding PadR family transcriptional regulator
MHGYRLIEELEERGYVDPRRLRSGSIYVILKRMEHRGLLTSIRIDPNDRRSPRIYSITEHGVQELIDGLKFVIERERVNDELIKYYQENFGGEDIK